MTINLKGTVKPMEKAGCRGAKVEATKGALVGREVLEGKKKNIATCGPAPKRKGEKRAKRERCVPLTTGVLQRREKHAEA